MKTTNCKMKLVVVTCMIVALCTTETFSQTATTKMAAPTATAGVLNIESKGVIPDAETVGNIVRLELEKTKAYKVFDRFDIIDVLKKNDLDISNCFAKSCLLAAGKALHADKMITGSVERYGEKIAITLKIVDVQTGEIEKANVTEYLNLQKEIQKMIEISVKRLVGLDADRNMVDALINYDQPVESALTTVNLSGPRAGVYYTDGIAGKRMRADKIPSGGLGMYTLTSMIGWQQEAQYLSSGNFQGIIECIFSASGLESGRCIPAFTFLNGFRLNRHGWEVAFGPTFRFVKKAEGFYAIHVDANGKKTYDPVTDWHLPSEVSNYYPYVTPMMSNLDDRGSVNLSAGLVIAAGKTFKSGYLNIPVNVYIIPRKEGTVYGLSLGFNVYKSSSKTK